MAKIKLVCDTCDVEFEKERKEYNRRIRLGKDKFYCCQSCASRSPANIEHIKNNRSNFPVWELAESKKRHDEYSMFRPTLKTIKARVKERNKDFDLTLEHLKDVWEQQEGKCPFTGFDLELRTYNTRRKQDDPLSLNSASLDRIDNDKGYVIGNVRWVSVMFNFARNKFSDDDVMEFAKAVVKHGAE